MPNKIIGSDASEGDMATQVDDVELIELIYASLLGESSWQAFLDRLSQAGEGCWSVLHSNSASSEEAVVGLISGRSPDDVADYPTYYHGISPWASHCHVRPCGKVTIVEDHVAGRDLERTEFYSDFLRRIATRSAIGIGLGSDDRGSVLISLMTPNAIEEQMRLLAAQMQRIAPHLKRAHDFYQRTSFAARSTELGATFFDALDMGVVIVGAGRRIRTCSDAARRMFGPDVGVDAMGRLRIGDQMVHSALTRMLTRTGEMHVQQRFLVGRTVVTLIPMNGDRERSFFEGPGVCLTIAPVDRGGFLDIDQFAAAYGLTKGETRVLEGLISGKTVTEIAHEVARSRETIRSQLKSLCAKTGTRGQADVLRLAAGMKT